MPVPSPRLQPFFSLEGLDGSGKSTQLALLEASLRGRGYRTLSVREPGGTTVSSRIREILLSPEHGEMAPMTELFLYSAARAQLVHQIIGPALEEGKVVLADRFGWSTLAYQGYGRGMDRSVIDSMLHAACGGIWPLHSFLLDISPSAMRERMELEGRSPDRMESENQGFYMKVREGYLALARENPASFTVLDAALDREVLQESILNGIGNCLEALKKEN